MRIDVLFQDRLGIAQEVLAVVAAHGLNVVAVEVDPPHVYVDAPGLSDSALGAMRGALLAVPSVDDVQPVDLLPGARRRLHLDALLAAMPDPVLLLDAAGRVVVGNAAALSATGCDAATLAGRHLDSLIGTASGGESTPDLGSEALSSGFRLTPREVIVGGEPYVLDCRPAANPDDASASPSAGGIVTLRPPQRLAEDLQMLQSFRAADFNSLLGHSPALEALRHQGARCAVLDAPVLILGETGTGKELVAHACHTVSPRKEAPFLALNCAAVPESLAESELFGYAPGAFSGAQRGGKPGLLELAQGGTVFLDEIGEMSPYLQAKLLRFLNDGSYRRVGGAREHKGNVRIIAATHRDLSLMVSERTFREDLYYRLNVLRLELPPLRARGEDIVLLARHFIHQSSQQVGRRAPGLSPTARDALLSHPWPGNVRQLQNVLFRAVTLCDHSVLGAEDLDLSLPAPPEGWFVANVPAATVIDWDDAKGAFERDILQRLYPEFPSSRKLATRLKTSHTMIANKLRKYGIGQP
jgi:TyrR family helix-turn-helix protein